MASVLNCNQVKHTVLLVSQVVEKRQLDVQLSGLIKQQAGEILFEGKDLSKTERYRKTNTYKRYSNDFPGSVFFIKCTEKRLEYYC